MTPVKEINKKFATSMNAISRLVDDKYFFQEYQKFIQSSTTLNKQNEFLYFISLNYIEAATVGIYRQLDTHWKSQSFLKVLKAINKNANLFTFQEYCKGTPSSGQFGFMAKNSFAQFAIKDGSRIDRRKLKKDIADLLKVTKPIVKYRHNVVAHKNRRNVPIKATVNDLYTAINLLERLAIKYHLLLTQGGMNTLLAGNTNPDLRNIFK